LTQIPYRVELSPAAERELARRRGAARLAIGGAILALRGEPRPRGVVKLASNRDLWRVRIRIDGQPWRLIYLIDDERRLIVITHIARRDEGTYRGL
jgi:mRNA-degrading endonuclease RelE of RelBE toxin-antitoxin system